MWMGMIKVEKYLCKIMCSYKLKNKETNYVCSQCNGYEDCYYNNSVCLKLNREPLDREIALEVCKSCNLKTIEIVQN